MNQRVFIYPGKILQGLIKHFRSLTVQKGYNLCVCIQSSENGIYNRITVQSYSTVQSKNNGETLTICIVKQRDVGASSLREYVDCKTLLLMTTLITRNWCLVPKKKQLALAVLNRVLRQTIGEQSWSGSNVKQ